MISDVTFQMGIGCQITEDVDLAITQSLITYFSGKKFMTDLSGITWYDIKLIFSYYRQRTNSFAHILSLHQVYYVLLNFMD